MGGEILQFGWRKRAVDIADWAQRVRTKLCSDLRFRFRSFKALEALDQLLDLLAGGAAHPGFAFHYVPPESLPLQHVFGRDEENSRNTAGLEHRKRLGVAEIPVVESHENVFSGGVQAFRNRVWRNKSVGVLSEVIQKPPKHFQGDSLRVGRAGAGILVVSKEAMEEKRQQHAFLAAYRERRASDSAVQRQKQVPGTRVHGHRVRC